MKRLKPKDQMQVLHECQLILNSVGFYFDVKKVLSTSRLSELVLARALIVLILRDKYSCSMSGAYLNRDHATILNLEKFDTKSQRDLKTYKKIKRKLKSVNDVNDINEAILYHENQIIKLKELKTKKQNQ